MIFQKNKIQYFLKIFILLILIIPSISSAQLVQNESVFTPAGAKPVVKNLNPFKILDISAVLQGNVTMNDNSAEIWFKYYDYTNIPHPFSMVLSPTETQKTTRTSNGLVLTPISNLIKGHVYKYVFCAKNSFGQACDDINNARSFTADDPNTTKPEVTTLPPTDITETSAKLNGKVEIKDVSAKVYFEYYDMNSVSAQQVNYGIPPQIVSTSEATVTTDGNFSAPIQNLIKGHTYRFYALARNSEGDDKGIEMSFVAEEAQNISGVGSAETTGYDGKYTLLAPIPGFGAIFDTKANKIADYLKVVFKLLIGIAGILSVVMIVIGGIQYMSAEAINSKEDGRSRIKNAILGLILALGSWIILNTINPDLLSLNIGITPADPLIVTLESTAQDTPQVPIGGLVCKKFTNGANWPTPDINALNLQDAVIRADLATKGVTVNAANCQKVGSQHCTSLDGFKTDKILSLLSKCPQCKNHITISGGTECWLHNASTTAHVPGSGVFDAREDPVLNKYITGGKNKAGVDIGNAFPNDGKVYVKNGLRFLAETPDQTPATSGKHWHIQ